MAGPACQGHRAGALEDIAEQGGSTLACASHTNGHYDEALVSARNDKAAHEERPCLNEVAPARLGTGDQSIMSRKNIVPPCLTNHHKNKIYCNYSCL